jgi:hypothetical protein
VSEARLISRKLLRRDYPEEEGRVRALLQYWCQGCKELHGVYVFGGQLNANWSWNGDAERPVFSPSVLCQRDTWVPPVTRENLEQWRAQPWEQHQEHRVCHTFVGCNGAQPGEVIFLSDCTHALAGTVQPLPDLPAHILEPLSCPPR